ncbi:hypothetical protein ES707_00195 [subsurface metagenome]
MAEEKPKCDIDDLMCQMQALHYLDGLEKLLGTEKFQGRYPEFKGLGDVVKERMGEQRGTIKEMMERCGIDTGEFGKEEGPIETEITAES